MTLDPARFVALQTTLDAWARQAGVQSVTVAVRVNGQTWRGSSRADGAPGPDPDAPYRVMSITKTVTAALVLRSVDAGLIGLDTPLPAIDGVLAPVPPGLTVRHLLAHRSGLAEYTEVPGYRADQPMTPEQAVELSISAPLVAEPGTVTRYVNSNYHLLGLLLQQVHRRPYADLVAGMLAPLGISGAAVEPPDRLGWPGFASGGLVATASDMATWGESLFTPGRVMSVPMLTTMTTTGELESGLGMWGMCPCTPASGIDRFSAIGHFTAAGGMFRFPATGVTLVMRTEPATGDSIGRAISLHRVLVAALSAPTSTA
jgi:CubicO group peptidase (beta-lactamase class C family)